MYYILRYDYVENVVERRTPFREAHLERARAAHARGDIVLAGALADPVDAAVFVFRASDPAVVERFVREDPYVQKGLVTRWSVRPWNVVIGGDSGG